MRLLSSHLVKRFTRLSGLALSGMCVATLGSWVRLLPTIPLMSAASVVTCLATMPVGWLGYPCVKASRMARYRRRLSLIVCSFWIGRTFHRAYTMRQPLNYLLQNDLAKVSGRENQILELLFKKFLDQILLNLTNTNIIVYGMVRLFRASQTISTNRISLREFRRAKLC